MARRAGAKRYAAVQSYLGNVAELSCANLGTGKGRYARGELEAAEAALDPFEVARDDAAALQGHVLLRLRDVSTQHKLHRLVSDLYTAAYRLASAPFGRMDARPCLATPKRLPTCSS
ncbi:hypothetical protein D9Q98_003872 [Chlorella vulgaris]|uniref:Uncharacterized protein n=1 Tax=Chlorella vulgaris TaxID=3077 RepID=A0A9D4YYH7_CHLVU|nr:hypothetical protein D9Q98_003872 [Chlorella vulgaris]